MYCNLASNSLSSLPESFGNMAMVTELDISHNQLTKLPASIGGMLLLAKLDVSHNALIDLPDEIKSLSNLQVPYLSFFCYLSDFVF